MRCGGPGLCSECAADASRARAALAQPSLMPPDRGPWHAVKWDGGRRVDLSSDDFEHDVALTVSGDFVEGDKFRYAQELAAWMNAHLAQPSPAPADEKPGDSILCYGCFAKGVGPEHFDEAGKCLARQQTEPLGAEFAQVLSDNLPELLSTGQAEQAEAERPEVVAWQYRVTAGPQTGWSLWHPGKGEEFERSYTVERRPLMTVAQHERIVGALRARNEKLEADAGALEWLRSTFKVHKAIVEQAGCGTIEQLAEQRDAANSRLHEVSVACATAEQERDAALARVAELERELRNEENAHTTTIEQRDNAEHWADQLANAIAERFGVDIGEHSNLNYPWNEALVWMQQPPAQAQHSVPEGFRELLEMLVVSDLRKIRYAGAWRREVHDRASSILALLAAAPGKEGV